MTKEEEKKDVVTRDSEQQTAPDGYNSDEYGRDEIPEPSSGVSTEGYAVRGDQAEEERNPEVDALKAQGFDLNLAQPTSKERFDEEVMRGDEKINGQFSTPADANKDYIIKPYEGNMPYIQQKNQTASVDGVQLDSNGKSSGFVAPTVAPTDYSEEARQAGQKMTRKFIAPHQNPTTYQEVMENMDARNEWQEEQQRKSDKWRLISQAILGAGEIAARLGTNTYGDNVMGDIMMKGNATNLDQLKLIRERNKDRYNAQLNMMLTERQQAITQANADREFRYKIATLQQKAESDARKLEIQGKNAEANAVRAKAAADRAALEAQWYGKVKQSEINRNNASAKNSNANAAKAQSETDPNGFSKDDKIVNINGREVRIPKQTNVTNLYNNAVSRAVTWAKNASNAELIKFYNQHYSDKVVEDKKAPDGVRPRNDAEKIAYLRGGKFARQLNNMDRDTSIISELQKLGNAFPNSVGASLDEVDKIVRNGGGNSRSNPYGNGSSTDHRSNPYG